MAFGANQDYPGKRKPVSPIGSVVDAIGSIGGKLGWEPTMGAFRDPRMTTVPLSVATEAAQPGESPQQWGQRTRTAIKTQEEKLAAAHQASVQKTPAAAAGKTNDKKPEGFGTNRVALDDNGSYVESANKAGTDRVRAGLAGNHAGGLTIMPNDQTGATMEQERLHREGMARLRSGMPYDASEAARFQQQQQMGQLFDIATGNSQVPRKGLGTRKLAADLLGSMHQFGAQRDYQNAALDENRRYHDLQIGVDAAKLAQPSVEKISSPYPVFDQFGNPVRNPKNNEIQMQNIPELMVNGVRQPSEQGLGALKKAAEDRAKHDPRANVPWYNPFKSSVDPQDLVAEKLNELNAQYGVNKKLVRGPNGEPMWEVPDLNLLGAGTSR